jgi:hypothetical protein
MLFTFCILNLFVSLLLLLTFISNLLNYWLKFENKIDNYTRCADIF